MHAITVSRVPAHPFLKTRAFAREMWIAPKFSRSRDGNEQPRGTTCASKERQSYRLVALKASVVPYHAPDFMTARTLDAEGVSHDLGRLQLHSVRIILRSCLRVAVRQVSGELINEPVRVIDPGICMVITMASTQ